jgi:DNA-binding GntR family transcriptional regulator
MTGNHLTSDHASLDAMSLPLRTRLGDRHQTIRAMVYEAIHTAIVRGEFAPGQRLRQDVIAESLGVSRSPVKATLVQLESEGLVSFQARRGAVVRSLSVDQARELYAIREVLEPLALRRSMEHMTNARLAGLRRLADELDAQADAVGFADASLRFFRELYDAERNPLIVEFIEELRSRVSRFVVGWEALQGQRGGHSELIGYVEAGDIGKAQEVLLRHLRSVEDGYEQMLDGTPKKRDRDIAFRPAARA